SFDPLSPMKNYCDLGVAVGQYKIGLHGQEPDDPLPTLDRIRAAIRVIHLESLVALPAMHALEHASSDSEESPGTVLTATLEETVQRLAPMASSLARRLTSILKRTGSFTE